MTDAGRRVLALAAAASLTAGVIGLIGVPGTAAAADQVEFTIANSDVTESSGLARDTTSGLYWTANDSGSEGVVYGIGRTGWLKGTFRYRAEPVDVEALAMSGSRLYVGDIGDNAARRDFVTVYSFNFPAPRDQTVTYQSYDFSYPDGAHDAETLLVNGEGRLFVVTKEAKGGIYAAPRQPSRQGMNTLERVGDAPGYVTDGVFLPDQKTIALRTYLSVELLSADDYRPTARAGLPLQPQGESLTVSLDGSALLAGSEGVKSQVYRIDIPTGLDEAPSGSASPPASTDSAAGSASPTGDATSSAPPTAGEPAEEDPNAGRSRIGTWWALGLAGVVALVSALVVALARTPRR
jgi:hypothetical protein